MEFETSSDIPVLSKWDGKYIYKTQQCDTCPYFAKFSDAEVCFGTATWKRLTATNKNIISCRKKFQVKQNHRPTQVINEIIYTPNLMRDLYDGTLDYLVSMGFKQRLSRKENAQTPGSFHIEKQVK